MRAVLLFSFFAWATAWANPIGFFSSGSSSSPSPMPIYLNSEKLLVSVSATDSVFSGSFTFATKAPLGLTKESDLREGARPVTVEMFIWFPEGSNGDPVVEDFWKTFHQGINVIGTNTLAKEVFERAVGLKVRIGDRELSPLGELGVFVATSDQEPNRDVERILAGVASAFSGNEPEFEHLGEPGLCRLEFWFHDCAKKLAWEHTPMTVSYRQPLVRM